MTRDGGTGTTPGSSLFSLASLRDRATRPSPASEMTSVLRDELNALLDVVDAARALVKRLDEGRAWNEERDQRDAVQRIDFAIGVSLSLRKPLDAFDE